MSDDLCTPSFYKFMVQSNELYFTYSIQLSALWKYIKDNQKVESDYLKAWENLYVESSEYDMHHYYIGHHIHDKYSASTKALLRPRHILTEAIFSRLVENFQVYLNDCLSEIIIHKPGLIMSLMKQVDTADIIRLNTRGEINSKIAAKISQSWSYKSIKDFRKDFKHHIGLDPMHSDKVENFVSAVIEMRNIIVHNRGIINEIHIKKVGLSDVADVIIDKKLFLHMNSIMQVYKHLISIAIRLDREVLGKFPDIEKVEMEGAFKDTEMLANLGSNKK